MITFKNEKPLKDYDAVSLAEMLRADFVRQYPARVVEQLQDAIQVASYLHRDDVRRGARNKNVSPPYIEHPLRVALRALRTFKVVDPNVIIAAVLHDTVEDHATDFGDFEGVHMHAGDEAEARASALAYISRHFGFPVARIVEWVSNPPITPGTSKAEKIAAYHDHVIRYADTSEFLIIKVSDFVDNAGSLHHHYSYGDPKVAYFLDRYEPLLPIYRRALGSHEHDFWTTKVQDRLDDVEMQFDKFRAAA